MKVNQFYLKWMRSIVSMEKGGRSVAALGLRGSINATSAGHGFTRSAAFLWVSLAGRG